MIKKSDPEKLIPLHADWTYVNESNYASAAIWVPFVDVNDPEIIEGLAQG